jgi:predicted DNA-binding transcriptional regulator YafY
MPRGDQLIRQWKLLHVLGSRGGWTVPELMREVRCSRRTIWRDLAVLQQAGFSLATEQDGWESRYRLLEGPRGTPPIPFNLPELMSLHMGRHLLVPLRGTPLGEAVHTALEKISATLGPAGRRFLDGLDRTMSARTVQAKDYSGGLETLRIVQQGLHDRRMVEAECHSFGRDSIDSSFLQDCCRG